MNGNLAQGRIALNQGYRAAFPAVGNSNLGITIKLLEDTKPTGNFFVYEVKTDSFRYLTKDGVKVGDSVSKAMNIYGRPESMESDGANGFSYFINEPTPVYFIFNVKNGQIKTITCGYFLG